MKIGAWNVRGLNNIATQKEVSKILKKYNIDLFGIIECKMEENKGEALMSLMFPNWGHCNNFATHQPGRIIVMWNPLKVEVSILEVQSQVIHLAITCKVTTKTFLVTFIYGLHSIATRRTLWDILLSLAVNNNTPWLLLGDFNSVLFEDERENGSLVMPYETRDFLNCALSLGLVDIPSIGCRLTWNNGRVWAKLDRAMVNDSWLQGDFQGSAHFLPAGCASDHSPCIVTVGDNDGQPKKMFKFFDMWTHHEQYQAVVQGAWNVNGLYGTAQYMLSRRLKGLKSSLRILNQEHFQHISVRAQRAKEELEDSQLLLHNDPRDVALQMKVQDLKMQARKLGEAERSFLYQKAKCRYLANSDRNTKFFHSIIKRNGKANYIASVQREDGSVTNSNEEVVKEFLDFYQNLLGSEERVEEVDLDVFTHGPLVSAEDCISLIKPVLDVEIKTAIFDIGNDRAPGPDGFSSGFFKSAWNIVGRDVCGAVREFFSNGRLLKQWNHTIIALIPKTKHASFVGDYRPISCCNVVYKAISKILASRMEGILPRLIDEAQSGFVDGRSMMENIHLAQELIKGYNRKRISPRTLIKVDLRKAYDSVNWTFLRSVMKGLGFPNIYVDWIMECVSSTSYSIRINGDIHGLFTGRRGLRQGDPVSPFLFVICMEYFSRMLSRGAKDCVFKYHPKCAFTKITHLAYADDLMLFSRGDIASVGILWDTLKGFGDVSGLRANVHKSQVYLAGVQDIVQEDILLLTGMPLGSLPVRYLGVPLAAQGLRILHYAPLLEKIASQIGLWRASTLSYAGRLELITSVLQGIHSFWLSTLPLPVGVVEGVVGLCRRFLWDGGTPLVAWRDLAVPKEEGGLGVRDAKAWNKALLTKALWNIHHKKDSLWVRWVHHIYLRRCTIWEVSVSRDQSTLFRRLLTIRDEIITKEGSIDLARSRVEGWESYGLSANAYHYFRYVAERVAWAKIIWASYIPPKYSFTLWLAMRGRLMTRDRLDFLDIDKGCGLCGGALESVAHLYFQCSFTRALWDDVKRWCGLRRDMSTLAASVKWLKKDSRGTTWLSRRRRIVLPCLVYYIWLARNRLHFDHLVPSHYDILNRVMTQVYRVGYTLYPSVTILD